MAILEDKVADYKYGLRYVWWEIRYSGKAVRDSHKEDMENIFG
jgi:hypothetical protein